MSLSSSAIITAGRLQRLVITELLEYTGSPAAQ